MVGGMGIFGSGFRGCVREVVRGGVRDVLRAGLDEGL